MTGNLPEEAYADRLLAEMSQYHSLFANREINTIFFGGGTPSLISVNIIHNLLNTLRATFPITKDCEITLEANPGAVDQARFLGFKDAGVNRLSIGVQSFQSEKLKALGRVHQDSDTYQAIHCAKIAGFDNFNLDLMYGLPNQSFAEAMEDLRIAISQKPNHISWYQLTLEPNTAFHHHPPPLPSDELIWDITLNGRALLAEHGYPQYEISAYAKESNCCRHNLNYWLFGDYIGIGAGAHSKITDHENQKILRFNQVKHPKEYLSRESLQANWQAVSPQALVFEFMLNALRLYQPIPRILFETRTSLPYAILEPMLNEAKSKELLTWNSEQITLTERGHNFYNDLLLIFMTES